MLPILQDEKELLSNLRCSDHEAFQELYHRYAALVYSRIKSLIHHPDWVEELHQDVFLKVWENRSKINEEVPFQAILLRTARSIAIDFYRKAMRDKQMQAQMILIATEYYTDDFFSSEDTEVNKALHLAIDKLSPQRKRIFSMIKLDGRKYEEVARELGITLSTVKDHMAKAMAFLRAELAKNHSNLLLAGFLMEIYKAFS